MAQFARPDADQATGSWATTPLWSKVEEGVASDDGTVITLASGNPNDNADLRLDDIDESGITYATLRADWGKVSGARTIILNLELWQGVPGTGSLVATLQTTDPTSNTDYSYNLTGPELANITDGADLYHRIYYTYSGGGAPSSCEVDAVELETSDASGPTPVGSTPTAGSSVSHSKQVAKLSSPSAGSTVTHLRVIAKISSLSALGTASHLKLVSKLSSLSALGTVTSAALKTVLQTASVTAGSVVSHTKAIAKTSSLSALATATHEKAISKLSSITAVGTVTALALKTVFITATVTAGSAVSHLINIGKTAAVIALGTVTKIVTPSGGPPAGGLSHAPLEYAALAVSSLSYSSYTAE